MFMFEAVLAKNALKPPRHYFEIRRLIKLDAAVYKSICHFNLQDLGLIVSMLCLYALSF